MLLAKIVLAIHLVVIGFNLFGLIAIPFGAWRGWQFVRQPRFRLMHFLSLTLVAIQALAGRACFLTTWQDRLAPIQGGEQPLIMRWVNGLIFWPLPEWLFTGLYVAVWLYALALMRIVPLTKRG